MGGHTNFRHAGVHIQPQVGSALFFSYIDPHSGTQDYGFTSHSGCPVYEGSKKIVTQWVRLGVDTENPHDSFNTLGVQEESWDDEDEDDTEEEDVDEEDEVSDDDDEENEGYDDDEAEEYPKDTKAQQYPGDQTHLHEFKGLQRIRHHVGRGLENLRNTILSRRKL